MDKDKIIIELKELHLANRIANLFDFIPEPSLSNIEYCLENIGGDFGEEQIRLLLWSYEGFDNDRIMRKILGLINQL